MSDTITTLRARYRRLAKLIRTDGTINDYDSAMMFDMAENEVADLDHLLMILRFLLSKPDLCIVRGAIADADRTSRVRRLYHLDDKTGDVPTIKDANHHWIGLDVEGVVRPDNVEAADLVSCGFLAIAQLPSEFHGALCIVQASAGLGLKPGCRLRLWFWGSRPLSGAELTYWMRRSPVDNCLFRPAQITYTSAPVFESGVDHLPNRILDLPGAATVTVPSAEELAPPKRPAPKPLPAANTRSGSRYALAALTNASVRVATAPINSRHYTCMSQTRSLGRLVEAGLLARSDVEAAMVAALVQAGKPHQEGEKVVAWALAHPSTTPLPEGVSL
jgi:hypothetical protein